jgi:2-hydroxy-3-oxopropionate reductase
VFCTGVPVSSSRLRQAKPSSVFQRALPLLQAMGQKITLIGGNGDGQTCKVANQIVVALNIEAVSEALVFAAKAGADPAKVREALMGGFAASRILEVHGERMLKRTFNPGFRIALHQKDLALALSGARTLGVALPNTATAQAMFTSCEAHGEGQSDHSGMVRALERLANQRRRGEFVQSEGREARGRRMGGRVQHQAARSSAGRPGLCALRARAASPPTSATSKC